MATSTDVPNSQRLTNILEDIWNWVKKVPPVYPVFFVVLFIVSQLNPNFATVNGVMAFLRRSSPLAILAMGQLYVLASGGFDLSQGSLINLTTIGSALIIYGNPEDAFISITVMLGIGVLVGLVNGLVVSYLKVPSLIATLGMLLLLRGGGLYWTGGAPKGYLSDNFRFFGRNYIENIPVIGRFPVAGLIFIFLGVILTVLFHKTNLGKQILAVGDNPKAARLSGVRVKKVRIIAFIISAVMAVIGGILLGGFGGVSIEAGEGMEMLSVSAAVIGGAVLLGGKGSVPNVAFGALTLEGIISLLNLLGLPKPYRDAVQGVIIIGAVAYTAIRSRRRD